jgi:hypothetical protein
MPMPTGNATITYSSNGRNYVLPFCTITDFNERPEYAPDGRTIQEIALTISGTCVFGEQTPPDLYEALQAVSIDGPGKIEDVLIEIGGEEFYYIPEDSRQGPFLTLSVTEIVGVRAAVATFTIAAHVTERRSWYGGLATQTYAPIAHCWTQSFSLDAGGLITRTVRGTLSIDISANGTEFEPAKDGTLAYTNDIAAWADLFRRVCLPIIPEGKIWRRESQTFAVNEAGTALTYEIVDSQARVQLPDGAYAGTADYSYERKRSSLALAIVRFECELEGPVDGDVRRLIWGAVVLAQSRIRFDQCLISRMVVQEMQLLKRSKIRFELEAEALATAIELNTPGATTIAVPMAQYIGKNFTMARANSQVIDPYGTPTNSYWAYPHWEGNTLSGKTAAPSEIARAAVEAFTQTAVSPAAPVITIIAPATDLISVNAVMNVGPFANKMTIAVGGSEQGTTRPIETVEAASSHTHVNSKTRMHRLQTLYTEGSDFVFQNGKPSVVITERMEIKRINKPPNRIMRPIPAGFVVLEDDWKTNFGAIDQNGNRTFTGVYTRTLLAYDGGGTTSNGYATSSSIRTWWSPSLEVQPPLSLGYDTDMQATSASVLVASTTGQGYSVGARPAYLA